MKTKPAILTVIFTILVSMGIIYLAQGTSTAPYTPQATPPVVEDYDMPTKRRITASQAKELMEKYPTAIILDVREEDEFNAGHIPGATLLPTFEISHRADYMLPDKYALILIYCRSGVRSRSAKDLLLTLGYVNVYDFGGINAWPYDIVR